ncbi:MAG: helicase [Magnetococcales bacterium]|nr:helicase [Magnetococcales bacterium]
MSELPSVGQMVRLRTRTYVVEAVEPHASDAKWSVVQGACLDDDAQGDKLEVVWGLERDAEILDGEAWRTLGNKGFDHVHFFGAYLNTLRWNCVTATDPKLFQAPFRAGIRLDAYQLEPLRKALLLPRVNLFIADDVGLGKTIEAGLIASELLLRRRVRDVVVACPPSMLTQWKEELENRFGLTFEILDREYMQRIRQERGFGINPWTTFPRFLVSHRLLIDETYTSPLRAWLDNLRPGSLLILDEAHHAAPSSGTRYAIDSKFTRAIRDIASRFEHRLFLSATPHNGHSNSFSSLLEILDSHRFTRGVKVLKRNLDQIMVRRLKEDIREIQGGFPKRHVVQVELNDLPDDTPELLLSKLLEDYRQVRERRYAGASKRQQAEAALLISGLQQRLLSSVEAFARTLRVHRRTMERIWTTEQTNAPPDRRIKQALTLWNTTPDADSEEAALNEEEQANAEDAALERITLATAGKRDQADLRMEKSLLDQMQQVAEASRGVPDARIRHLVAWIAQHMCSGVHLPGERSSSTGKQWSGLRLLIFTEYDDTKRYLVHLLRAAIDGTDQADQRIEVFHGPTPSDKRDAIKRAFNLHPDKHPLRILVATDAAREGLNLQAYCWNLFHFDVPWNPARLEQRNGRIDRKMQPHSEVFCHYFVYAQRPEDRVLQALIRKTDIIRRELGSLAPVLSQRLAEMMKEGIRRDRSEGMVRALEDLMPDRDRQAAVEEELEETRERQDKLQSQINRLRGHLNDARKWIGLEVEDLQQTLSCSLEMLGAEPLHSVATPEGEPQRWAFPNLETRRGADPTWSATLDTLRAPPNDGRRSFDWRRESSIRPVVFTAPDEMDDDVVQMHLEHRVVQRLLGRFLSQGFVHHDLSRACLAQTADAIPRVILVGRLSLYGQGAVRLHDEMLTVTARWIAPERRKGRLQPYGREAEGRTLELLQQALRPQAATQGHKISADVQKRLLSVIGQDIQELLEALEVRGTAAKSDAERSLLERGRTEADAMRTLLEEQRKKVLEKLGTQLTLDFDDLETRQLEADRRYWQRWLDNVDQDLKREPTRIREFYSVSSHRIEPVGVAYLWPVTEVNHER